ncbi:MAG: 5-formyltetrahydrofolate cyclo-ligase [Planctomycetaceae bacterium]|nr:5-formyltetrahydrofolate cyclo-ligase [Planctomycetaceae bacterium]
MNRDLNTWHFKRAQRRSIIAAILALDFHDREAREARLIENLPALPGYEAAESILLYVKGLPEELDSRPFFRHALQLGKRVLCPRVDRSAHRLRLFRVTSLANDLEPGILGIPEPRPHCPEVDPSQVDWALIPGLAFDRQCYRLGRGGGHYDRLLPLLRPDALCWGMGFNCQIVPRLPVEPHDVPLSGVATEEGIIRRV